MVLDVFDDEVPTVATTYVLFVDATKTGAVYVTLQCVNVVLLRVHDGVPSDPLPTPVPLAVLNSAKLIPVVPPASAIYPVKVSDAPEPSAAFSGDSGCRNPGVMVMTVDAEMVGFAV
jgi:hypothetical protein